MYAIDEQAEIIVAALNAAQQIQVSVADWNAWYEGEGTGSAERFDFACLNIMTQAQFDAATSVARGSQYLCYKLGIGSAMCGGIDLSAI